MPGGRAVRLVPVICLLGRPRKRGDARNEEERRHQQLVVLQLTAQINVEVNSIALNEMTVAGQGGSQKKSDQ